MHISFRLQSMDAPAIVPGISSISMDKFTDRCQRRSRCLQQEGSQRLDPGRIYGAKQLEFFTALENRACKVESQTFQGASRFLLNGQTHCVDDQPNVALPAQVQGIRTEPIAHINHSPDPSTASQ